MTNPYRVPPEHSMPTAEVDFPLRVSVEVTPETLMRGHFALHGTGSAVIRYSAGCIGLLSSLVTLVIARGIVAGDATWADVAPILGVLASTGAILWFWAIRGKPSLRWFLVHYYRKHGEPLGAVEYELTPAGMQMRDGQTVRRMRWDQVVRRRFEDTLVLSDGRRQHFVVPLTQFSAAAQDLLMHG